MITDNAALRAMAEKVLFPRKRSRSPIVEQAMRDTVVSLLTCLRDTCRVEEQNRWQDIVKEFCDFALSVGAFHGRDHDIQEIVDAAWTALRKRAGILYGKYGQSFDAILKEGFVDMAGHPVKHEHALTKELPR